MVAKRDTGVRKGRQGRRLLGWLMTLCMLMTLFSTQFVSAASGDTPEHGKKLIKNDDGTYTIALSVTGDAEKVTEPVNTNVIVILDTSGSMDENTGNTEVTYTPSNQTANNMYGTNDGGQTYFQIYRRGFWPNYYYTTTQYGNTRYTGQRYLRQAANQTRLEAAQDAINDLAAALLSKNGQDGNPSDLIEMALVTFDTTASVSRTPTTSLTQFQNAVNNTEAEGGTNWEASLTTANGINFGDDDQTFVIFVSDGNPTFRSTQNGWNDRYQQGVYGTGQETNQNITRCYTTAVPAAQALANKVTTGNFFTIGAYGNVDRMEDLTTDAGAPAANYFSAENTAALQEALATILEKIEMEGIADVGITDGTTEQVNVESSTANLLNVDTSSFKYYRAGGVDEEDNVKYDPDANTATTADGQTLKLGEEWNGAPEASYEDSTVNWNLSDVGVLENGVTYTVTFDCWPSQDTLDYLADIENGLYDTLPAAAKEYIDEDGNLDTNTVASLSYKDTRTGESGGVDYVNPDPVTSDAVEQLAVAKEWQNDVDSQSSAPITLDVTRDGTHKYDLTLSSANNWQGNIFISIGMMRTGENGDMEILASGHDFTFVEPEDVGYRWELDIPVVHPMLIDGELTMLIKVDADHQPGSAKTYTIKGAEYYVGSTGEASLTATNYRRSQLVLTKVVEGEDVPDDATFPFTLTVNNSKEDEGTEGNLNSDYYVWFTTIDDAGENTGDVTVTGATAEEGAVGWYHVPSGTPFSVDLPAGYSVRFINLPKGSTYEFEEGTLASGFIFASAALTAGEDESFEGDQTTTGTVADWNSEYVVTYTNQYVLKDVTVTKVWDDADDQDGKRPDELALTLNGLPEGETAPAPTVTESEDGNSWTYTWSGLPKYDTAGEEITYTVTEETVPEGYTCETTTVDEDGTITNVHEPEVTEATVKKVWNDNDNQDGKRPASLQVKLSNGTSVTLTEQKQWTDTIENLPKYADGKEIVYTWTEGEMPAGYTLESTDKEGTITTLTNGYTPQETAVYGEKAWAGDTAWADEVRPDSVTVNLLADGEPAVDADGEDVAPATATADDNWAFSFTNLPKYADGEEIEYTVEEEEVAGYTLTSTTGAGTSDDPFVITNTYTPNPTTATFDVKKVLDIPTGLTGPEEWEYTITAAAQGSAPATAEASQTVDQDNDTATFTFAENAFTKPGTYTYKVTESGTVEGVVNDEAAASGKTVTITVTGDNEGNLSAEVSGEEDAAVTFTNKYSAGSVIVDPPVQKVIENDPGLYNKGDFTFVIENTAAPEGIEDVPMPENTSITNSAAYERTDKKGYYEFGEIEFTAPGTYTYQVTESGNAAGVTNDEEAAKSITFTVSDDGKGGLKVAPTTDQAVFTFTNTYDATGSVTLEATKELVGRDWTDNDTFTFTLLDEDGETLDEQQATAASKTVTFTNIPYTLDDAGKKHTYTITENERNLPAGVTKTSDDITVEVTVADNGDGTLSATPAYTPGNKTITNTYTPDPTTATIEVTKTIDGYVSEEDGYSQSSDSTFEFTLYDEDGEKVGDPIEITTKGGVGGPEAFAPITYKKAGTYNYTVKETKGDKAGYTYSTKEYPVTVTVTDDPALAKLTAEVSYGEGTGEAAPTSVEVENQFKIESAKVTLELNKTIEDQSDSATDGEFTFKLYKDSVSDENFEEEKSLTTKNLKGSVKFSELTFDKPGTYTYVVVEEAGDVNGMTYDTTEHTYEITINDNFDAAILEVTEDSTTSVDIVNVYKAEATSTILKVRKEIKDKSGSAYDTEFTFTLKDENGEEIDTQSITGSGEVSFAELTYEKAGTYKYTIEEKAGDAAGWVYDSTKYNVTVTVEDVDGKLQATAAYMDAETGTDKTSLTITNTYDPEDATITLNAKKIVDDKTGGASGKTFKFELVDADGKVIATATRQGGGPVTFEELSYGKVGTYEYTIREVAGSDKGYTYDTAEYPVTVEVTDDGEGKLVAEVTSEEEAVFTNIYEAEPVSLSVEATKVLQGRDLTEGEFTFQLKDGDEVIAEATNDADGKIVFDELTFDEPGTYKYLVLEVIGDDSDITYDTNVYPVTIEVTDDGEGELKAACEDEITFTNVYEEPPVPDEPEPPAPEPEPEPEPPTPKTGDDSMGTVALLGLLASAALLGVFGKRRRATK